MSRHKVARRSAGELSTGVNVEHKSGHNDARDAGGRVICWGEVLWDLFPDGRRLGGAPANVAYHLAQLGAPVALVSRVGDDALGREAVARLAASGVDTSLIQVDAERPTGRVEVEVHGCEPRYRLTPGCAWERIALTAAAARALADAAVFCYGTLSQRLERAEFLRALQRLPPGCVKVCDPNLRPSYVDMDLVRVSLGAADVVKINDVEAQVLAERTGMDSAVAWMQGELGVRRVALTRGARGSVLIDSPGQSDKSAERPAKKPGELADEHPGFPAASGGDNVGAGDAYTAALIRFRDCPLAAVNRAANRYAAFVASCRGASPEIPADLVREVMDLALG